VPHRAISATLARSVRPLLFENDDQHFQYSKRGSCCLVAYRAERLIVFTEHQRDGYSPESIRIVQNFTGGPSIAVDTFLSVDSKSGEEFEDLRGLKVARDHHAPEQLSDFFPIADHLPPVQNSKLLIAVGVPTELTMIDYEPAHIHAETVSIACTYEARSAAVTGLHSAKITTPPSQQHHAVGVDGLSGGAIFSVDGKPGAYVVHFRGTILRGGNNRLHFMDVAAIRMMFNKMQQQA